MPTFGSLFAGIGGIDLGLERAGWTCRWQVEWDAWCQRVLAKHWPDVPRYGDITRVDWAGVERVDLLAGGFPCQPFSLAGKRLGKSDDRWLWPEFARAIRELRPEYVLGDLAALGFDAVWDSVPASAVGAPHRRYRVWTVAHANDLRRRAGDPGERPTRPEPEPSRGTLPDAERQRLEEPERREAFLDGGAQSGRDGAGNGTVPSLADADVTGSQGLRGSALPRWETPAGHSGSGRGWLPEPDVGRVAHGVPSRVDRLRGLGNAVVPQVAEVIGRRLLESL